MLKDLISECGYTIYNVSKNTGIPYATLVDLVNGKTKIENTSAGTLFRLAKYLELSMESLYLADEPNHVIYLYNDGPVVFVDYDNQKMQFRGPKNLVAFKKVNRITGTTVCADTYYKDGDGKIYIEEEYIDLKEVFSDYSLENVFPKKLEVKIGKPGTSLKERLLNEALMVCDSMVISYEESSTGGFDALIVNLNRTQLRMRVHLESMTVLNTNMSERMQKRVLDILERNRNLILSQIKREEKIHA